MASLNQYEEAIARAKAALDSYSAEAEALKELYENAKANARTAHETQKQQLAEQTAESRRRADVDMQKTERNLDQRLAARGLAFSGENAQTRLDLTLALRNRLADIDSEYSAQSAALDQSLADKQSELDLAYASDRSDRARQLASLNADLASAEAGKQAALEAARAAAAQEAAAQAAREEAAAAKEAAAQAAAAAKQQAGNQNSKPGSTGSADKDVQNALQDILGDTGESDKGITPQISARDLAKQMVATAGSNGSISTGAEQAKLTLLLDSLLESIPLDSDYYRNLMLNLRSLGYRPDYAQNSTSGSDSQIQKEAANLYETNYRRYFNIHRNAGESITEADRIATSEARYEQIRYLFTHSTTQEQFLSAVKAMELSSYLSTFYARAQTKDKVSLGSEV